MSGYSVKRIDEMEASFQGAFKKARAELGVTSFGIQVLDLPPNLSEGYPEHDHSQDGQEEVYAFIRGSGRMQVEGEDVELSPDVLVRVGPGVKRKITSGPEGLRILAIGGVPGAAYQINPSTELTGSSA
jgi:mannose-6-phosphate isomerase-like protein (cupin superfamily)